MCVGVSIAGSLYDREGLARHDRGRVRGLDDVFAVGDVTDFPIKQGGIAAGQADLVAHIVARQAGAPLAEPPAARPALRGPRIQEGRLAGLVRHPTRRPRRNRRRTHRPGGRAGRSLPTTSVIILANAPTLD